MAYDETARKIDFLNHRMRKMEHPWYQWSIKFSWEKIDKWCALLGYKEYAETEIEKEKK